MGAALAVLLLSACCRTVYPRVRVLGVTVGGLTEQEAARRLEQQLERCLDRRGIRVAWGEQETLLTFRQLGVAADESTARAAAAAAYACGRDGGLLKNALFYLRCLFLPVEAQAPLSGREEAVRLTVEELARRWDEPKVDFSYELGEEEIWMTRARDGRVLQQEQLCRLLLRACRSGEVETLRCPGEAQQAAPDDPEGMHRALAGEMQNARYDPESKTCLDGRVGVRFSLEAARAALNQAREGERVWVPAEIRRPGVLSAEQLQQLLFRDVLGSYTTYVSGSSGRLCNVRLSAEKCSGVVLNSGELFDFNRTVGRRTYSAGYRDAPAYVGGRTENLIGGGICQTSSTLYVAAVYANLQIVQRRSHSFASSYVPLGYDATVSWGGPEFQFQNNTDFPIQIAVGWQGRNLTVKILGTNLTGQYARLETRTLEETPYRTVYQTVKDLPPGQQRVVQTPYTGYRCQTDRLVYDAAGNLLSRSLESSSVYQARDEIVQVGAPAEPALPPEEPAPDGRGEEPPAAKEDETADFAAGTARAEAAAIPLPM